MSARRGPRGRGAALLRFVGSVLAMSGVLLVADVGATLLWQEPVSAFMAARDQDALEDELAAEAARFAPAAGPTAPRAPDAPVTRAEPPPGPAAAARTFATRLRRGRAVGRIVLPTLDESYVIAEGTDTATLRKGPGHYPGSGLPGMRRPVAVAGHRTTYGAPFADIDGLERGAPIVMEMPYGRFTYRVTERRIVEPDAIWVTRRGTDRLVLTSCHPPLSAAQRIVVFADLVREAR